MICAYVGIVTSRGLELFYNEGEHTARFVQARLRRTKRHPACCVWFVMDQAFDAVARELLDAGHTDGAWAFVQDVAREYGPLFPEEELAPQCEEFA